MLVFTSISYVLLTPTVVFCFLICTCTDLHVCMHVYTCTSPGKMGVHGSLTALIFVVVAAYTCITFV